MHRVYNCYWEKRGFLKTDKRLEILHRTQHMLWTEQFGCDIIKKTVFPLLGMHRKTD